MEKNIFILLICVLLAVSNSQILEQNPNIKSLRRLEQSNETILIGFGNYQQNIMNSENQFNLTFDTYFLLKYWNISEFIDNKQDLNLDSIEIKSNITNEDNKEQNINFKCNYTQDSYFWEVCENEKNPYCPVKFICQANCPSYPKKINIYTDFEKEIEINKTKLTYESTSAKAIKKNIKSLNNFDPKIDILANASFITKNQNSFKIEGEAAVKNIGSFGSSHNIELIILVNGYPKKIPCNIKEKEYDPDDNEKYGYMYFIETNEQNNLVNSELKYALFNYTKGSNRMGILDFKEGENSTFIENTYLPKKKKGLSTGAIIGIIIPSCIVLLGVSALVFLLSRKPLPAQQIKNIGNNTIGVASSEAVVHQ